MEDQDSFREHPQIVQERKELFKVRRGLWALTSEKKRVLELFGSAKAPATARDLTHYLFQGLLVEIGNLKGFQTHVPAQDTNRPFTSRTLGDIASPAKPYEFTFPDVLRRAATMDVAWYNTRRFPDSFFEVEHSTDIQNALVKFMEFQDFRVNLRIVADQRRRAEFDSKPSQTAFAPIKSLVKFWPYETVADLHSKLLAIALAEQAL